MDELRAAVEDEFPGVVGHSDLREQFLGGDKRKHVIIMETLFLPGNPLILKRKHFLAETLTKYQENLKHICLLENCILVDTFMSDVISCFYISSNTCFFPLF